MKILSRPKGNAEEYGRWSVNPYKGCPHGCLYCYLKKGAWAKGLGGSVPVLKEHVKNVNHAYYLAMAEIIENRDQIIKDGGLFMTFTSDPCIKQTRNLTFTIAHDALMMRIPVMMLTKDATFLNLDPFDEKIIGLDKQEDWERSIPFYHSGSGRLSFIDNPHFTTDTAIIAIGFTLTGHDELEPNASPNAGRINAMQRLNKRLFKTWASIEPVITFDSSFEMIQQALDAGCTHFKIGLMTNNTKVCRNGFSYGGHDFAPYNLAECCQFVGYVMELTERYDATVYWKQSFVDFLEISKKDPQPVHGMTAREFLSQWKHSVGKDWSMFSTLTL